MGQGFLRIVFFFGLPSGCTTDDEKLVTSFIDWLKFNGLSLVRPSFAYVYASGIYPISGPFDLSLIGIFNGVFCSGFNIAFENERKQWLGKLFWFFLYS